MPGAARKRLTRRLKGPRLPEPKWNDSKAKAVASFSSLLRHPQAIYPFMLQPHVGTLPIKTAAPSGVNIRLRRMVLNIHLWIGLGFAVLLIPISHSDALLVWLLASASVALSRGGGVTNWAFGPEPM